MAALMLLVTLFSLCLIFGNAAGQKCRDGWHYFAGSCYGFGESAVAWGDAQELCVAMNAKLAEVETAAENVYLKNLVRNKQARETWLGGTDIFNEGTWEWVSTGKKISPFSDWAPGQPDDAGHAEDCLTYYKDGNYQWNDEACDHTANFLCEAVPTDVIIG